MIHAGSGRQILDGLEFCNRHDLTMIQGSSQLSNALPERPPCTIIVIPNFADEVIQFISQLGPTTETYAKAGITPYELIESHQASKKTVPVTAKVMAKIQASKVNGHAPYGFGAMRLAVAAVPLWSQLGHRLYSSEEFMRRVKN